MTKEQIEKESNAVEELFETFKNAVEELGYTVLEVSLVKIVRGDENNEQQS